MTDKDRHPAQALPLAEAAARLGLTTDALRMRIRRGTARGFKRAGQVFVWLDPDGEKPRAGRPARRAARPGRPHPDARPTAAPEAEAWSAMVALQREEIARLIQETDRLNARLERHLDEAREMRQMLQREQVLRQQEQALRRDTHELLRRLIAHPALAPALGATAAARAAPPAPEAAGVDQGLAEMLKDIGQSLRDLETRAAPAGPDGHEPDPEPPDRD